MTANNNHHRIAAETEQIGAEPAARALLQAQNDRAAGLDPNPDDRAVLEDKLRRLQQEIQAITAVLDGRPPLKETAITDHEANPMPVTWLVKKWMPDATLTVLTGAGGAGKSRVALQLGAAVASGQERFITAETADTRLNGRNAPASIRDQGRVVFAAWETRHITFANRLAQICSPPDSKQRKQRIAALNGEFHYLNMRPYGGLWGNPPASTAAGQLLPGGRDLLDYAANVEARLLIIDPIAAAYAGNENDRTMVRAFLSHLDQWAEDHSCAVLLIAHPPKSPHAQSGSTDWRNGVQAVWELTTDPDTDTRTLKMDKLNEGPRPDDITLAYDKGRFVEPTETASQNQRPKQ